jgi:hypothetical protein
MCIHSKVELLNYALVLIKQLDKSLITQWPIYDESFILRRYF